MREMRFWLDPVVEWVKERWKAFKVWWDENPIQQKRRYVGGLGVGLFVFALIIKATAVLMESAIIGFGGFIAFWVIWSFASSRFPKLDEVRFKHQGKIEMLVVFGCPILIGLVGGTLPHLIGGWLMGEVISMWNLSALPQQKEPMVLDAEFQRI